MANDLDVHSLLSISDLLITRASTVAEEALVMGKKVIAFDLVEAGPAKDYKHLEAYQAYQTIYPFSSPPLKDVVCSALLGNCNSASDHFIEEEFTYSLDGKSAYRVANEVIDQLIGGRH